MSDESNALSEALTVAEVARYWKKNRSTVRYHVDRGNMKARYTFAGQILVERDSVIALWGQPEIEINESDF